VKLNLAQIFIMCGMSWKGFQGQRSRSFMGLLWMWCLFSYCWNFDEICHRYSLCQKDEIVISVRGRGRRPFPPQNFLNAATFFS